MPVARDLALFVAAILIVCVVGCGSDDSAAKLKAVEAEHPLGPFEGTDGKFSTTDTGLKYRITREGTGGKPAVTDTVTVHYVGKLADGTKFDSSYERQRPAEFALQGVVAGWTEGLQLVAQGGQIDLIIPAELGYGPYGQDPIPPGATLYFTVELLNIKPAVSEDGASNGGEPVTSDPVSSLGPFAGTEAEGEFTTTDSGLMYRIIRQGKDNNPKSKDIVIVHYEGSFADGKEFDSTYERDEPATFPVDGVILGWTEGLQLIGEGGKIQLALPSALGYGARGKGSILPNTDLYFTVELLKINP
jgi:peptidylprolyl isomerase